MAVQATDGPIMAGGITATAEIRSPSARQGSVNLTEPCRVFSWCERHVLTRSGG
jgi:hypothetical protein